MSNETVDLKSRDSIPPSNGAGMVIVRSYIDEFFRWMKEHTEQLAPMAEFKMSIIKPRS